MTRMWMVKPFASKPFQHLTVVLRRELGAITARIRQEGREGANLLPRHKLTSMDSAKAVVGELLCHTAEKIEFVEE